MYSEVVNQYLNKNVFIRSKSGNNLHVKLLSVDRETCHYVIPEYEDAYKKVIPARFGHINTQDIESITETHLI